MGPRGLDAQHGADVSVSHGDGAIYDSGDYLARLDEVRSSSPTRPVRHTPRRFGEARQAARVGVGPYIEGTGGVPQEFAEVRVLPDGVIDGADRRDCRRARATRPSSPGGGRAVGCALRVGGGSSRATPIVSRRRRHVRLALDGEGRERVVEASDGVVAAGDDGGASSRSRRGRHRVPERRVPRGRNRSRDRHLRSRARGRAGRLPPRARHHAGRRDDATRIRRSRFANGCEVCELEVDPETARSRSSRSRWSTTPAAP